MDQAASDDGPQGPIFFLSYAHGPGDALARRFFGELSDDVHQLVGLSTGDDAGFMDVASFQGGERWSEELLTAVGTCPVFVPLISPKYVRSEWCAREWHAFGRRSVVTVPPGQLSTPVLPVLWSALSSDQMPRAIRSLQFFQPSEPTRPDLVKQYWREGVYGLGIMRRVSYRTVVWRIAQQIARIYASHQVTHGFVTDHTQLPSSWADR